MAGCFFVLSRFSVTDLTALSEQRTCHQRAYWCSGEADQFVSYQFSLRGLVGHLILVKVWALRGLLGA